LYTKHGNENVLELSPAFLLLFVGVIVTLVNQFGKQVDQTSGYGSGQVQQGTQNIQPTEEVTQVTQIPQLEDMKAPKMSIDVTKKYTATMKTAAGDIELELFADKTPITVNNFVFLAKKNFYNNVIFHRVIKGFMIQGGDPTGTGSGDQDTNSMMNHLTENIRGGLWQWANAGPNTNGKPILHHAPG